MNTQPIIVERLLDANVANVWEALTQNEKLKEWYFKLLDFKAEVGFNFQFSGGPKDGIQYLHLCEVTEVIPEKKLTYSWRYDGYEGNSFVSFELFPREEKTLLRLTHIGVESFPANNPDFAKHNFEAGWDSIVNTSLANFIEAK